MKLYTSRKDKPQWVIATFKAVLSGSILDVGCDTREMSHYVKDYTGIDKSGKADINMDIDKASLPFKDRNFDTVYCSEVLEHLENIHSVFDELCRVSRRYVLVSLPNALAGIDLYAKRKVYPRQGFGKYMKFYGLPFEAPEDRHRWFFSTEEAMEFVKYRASKNGFKVKKVVHTIDCEKRLLNFILSGFNRSKMLDKNNASWFLMERG